jgi:3-methyladenine DNA glycosylase AlkC
VEPFKKLLGAAPVLAAGGQLQRLWPAFDRQQFERQALQGLERLELKARAQQIAAALDSTLPPDFAQAADLIEASLAPAQPVGAPPTDAEDGTGLRGWIIWPMTEFVARRGLQHPDRALSCLHALTQRLTAEWAIRPFIETHPQLTWARLQRWTTDPSAHVRRLVSEGSRPRLPWGQQLKGLIRDPAPSLPLLRALQDDPSDYVRRSVANHLNDIAKDHPDIVVDWVARYLPGAPPARRALLRHACRSLIKQGEPRVLALWGTGQALEGSVRLRVSPARLQLGERLTLEVRLQSRSRQPQPLLIDYAVHHVRADQSSAPKVFKGWTLELGPGEERLLRKTHAVRPITTRRYHAGRHVVDLRINGRICAVDAFELRLG